MENTAAVVPSEKAKGLAKQIFDKFDADHNGSIDKEEARPIFIDYLRKAHVTKLIVDDAVLAQWFDKADLNKDGVISTEEAAIFIETYMLPHAPAE